MVGLAVVVGLEVVVEGLEVVVGGLEVVVVEEGLAVVLWPPQANRARHALPSSLPTGGPEA